MDYSQILDVVTSLGYRLAMSGAETYRVEESINRILNSYGLIPEVFVIPNCMHICLHTPDRQTLTRMRRIGHHGNDLDAVEVYTGVSRRICAEKPDPVIAKQWIKEADTRRRYYKFPMYLLGNALGAFGFAFLFGGSPIDALCSGFCGILVGLVSQFMEKWGANPFFRIIAAAFIMAIPAYGLNAAGLVPNPDAAVIGALMILVPGLLFTNAMRDIIYGDTNSGINRVVQVLLIAMAIALGTAAAWNVCTNLWSAIPSAPSVNYHFLIQALAAFVSCVGFGILFNVHGPGGLLCALGGTLTWLVYLLTLRLGGGDLAGYFFGTLFASLYAEAMARIRKFPAIAYLVISIFPLIPGAGAYYTMNSAVQGQMDKFASQGMHTAAIAGVMAVAILLVSTAVRMISARRK